MLMRRVKGSYRRKTIMLDINNRHKLQLLQAKLIEKTKGTVSFSYVLEEMLRRYYKLE